PRVCRDAVCPGRALRSTPPPRASPPASPKPPPPPPPAPRAPFSGGNTQPPADPPPSPAVPFHALPRLHERVQARIANLDPGYLAATAKVNRYLFGRKDARPLLG